MPFESELPSAFPEHLRWRTIPIPKAVHMVAFIAGPPVGIKAHHVAKASKPCLRWLTDGREFCPVCGSLPVRQIVYLPCYLDKSWDRRVIIISRTSWEPMQFSKFGDRFTAIQDTRPKQPALVYASVGPNITDVLRAKERAKGPQCIKRYLMHLWRLDHLDTTDTGPDQIAA